MFSEAFEIDFPVYRSRPVVSVEEAKRLLLDRPLIADDKVPHALPLLICSCNKLLYSVGIERQRIPQEDRFDRNHIVSCLLYRGWSPKLRSVF